ncbi:uncharacterized protein EV420DRAFT_1621179 [Desarmillaria tabescens]|uniref:Uncharacterized protein n=1 Tax=Armillaria tabescens TaxID=1929756 RepID=A0AA39KE42_ARMTA|nr:uncharacterized protein EV420DRAFT_1621179 [Desarmillaria tabescens]KAK0457123.1 hypothetical protein EV420DRAFT_1621179 [Desarmillaria tabescens]
MSALTGGVPNKAPRHAELLKSIATLDYVPPHLSDLQSQVKRLTQTLVEERHEFLDLKDSTGRKMWSKVTGKKDEFQARINKEEREYVEALEKEIVEKRNVEMLEQMIAEALTVKAELSENLEKYTAMKKELQDMYSSLFDGRAEEFPHDDELEQQLAMAESTHARLLAQLNSDSQVVKLLRQAESKMQAAQTAMKEAVEMSFYVEISYPYATSSVEVMEQSALGQAEFRSSQAKVLIEQARNISPLIQPMPKFEIPTAYVGCFSL